MEDRTGGVSSGVRVSEIRGQKRKRSVSWAAAELLEEVKLFHMAKPVNPSIPPPLVDNGEDGDAANQPGLALLGLLGVDPSSSSSPPPPSPSSSSPASKLSPPVVAVATIANAGTSFQSSAPINGSSITSSPTVGLSSRDGQWGGGGSGGGTWPGSTSSTTGATGGNNVGGVGGGGVGGAGGRTGGGGSRLFKGFEKTETVVRRKKQVAPPPPPPGTPPPLPPPGEGEHLAHRYPKDIWPGHKPPDHGSEDNNGYGGGREGAAEPLEFFCDGCDETVPEGTERMECAVCPDEFCLCHACYDEGEVLDKRHEHELLSSAASFHITRAAPSAEAAAAAAKALHVTESQQDDDGGLHEGYDDDDLG